MSTITEKVSSGAEKKHTPGPWHVWEVPPYGVVNVRDRQLYTIVQVWPHEETPFALANARLTAAAPMQHDLLVALAACQSDNKPVREWAQKYGVELGNATNGRVLDKAIEAAISKAERGQ